MPNVQEDLHQNQYKKKDIHCKHILIKRRPYFPVRERQRILLCEDDPNFCGVSFHSANFHNQPMINAKCQFILKQNRFKNFSNEPLLLLNKLLLLKFYFCPRLLYRLMNLTL